MSVSSLRRTGECAVHTRPGTVSSQSTAYVPLMSQQRSTETATSVTLAFSPSDDEDITDGIEADAFRGYLRKAHDGPVALGDEWDEFVNCGCGSTKDVTLQVVSITGGEAVSDDTDIEYEPATS